MLKRYIKTLLILGLISSFSTLSYADVCGNSSCESAENCSNCPGDCPEPPPATSCPAGTFNMPMLPGCAAMGMSQCAGAYSVICSVSNPFSDPHGWLQTASVCCANTCPSASPPPTCGGVPEPTPPGCPGGQVPMPVGLCIPGTVSCGTAVNDYVCTSQALGWTPVLNSCCAASCPSVLPPPCPPGTQGCPCGVLSTCNSGLTCQAGTCVVPTPGPCTSFGPWVNGGCGAAPCGSGQMYQSRWALPTGCGPTGSGVNYQCISDASCILLPPPPGPPPPAPPPPAPPPPGGPPCGALNTICGSTKILETDTVVGGILVQLRDATSRIKAVTKTDLSGNFLFSPWPEGVYYVDPAVNRTEFSEPAFQVIRVDASGAPRADFKMGALKSIVRITGLTPGDYVQLSHDEYTGALAAGIPPPDNKIYYSDVAEQTKGAEIKPQVARPIWMTCWVVTTQNGRTRYVRTPATGGIKIADTSTPRQVITHQGCQ